MSQLAITKYLNELSDLKKVSGSKRESVVREAFKDLLKAGGRAHNLVFIPEYESQRHGRKIGAMSMARWSTICACPLAIGRPRMRRTTSTQEIEKKFRRGYPQDNIIFEDSHDRRPDPEQAGGHALPGR